LGRAKNNIIRVLVKSGCSNLANQFASPRIAGEPIELPELVFPNLHEIFVTGFSSPLANNDFISSR